MKGLLADIEDRGRLLPQREWDGLTEEERFWDRLGLLDKARAEGLIKARSDGGSLLEIVKRSRPAIEKVCKALEL